MLLKNKNVLLKIPIRELLEMLGADKSFFIKDANLQSCISLVTIQLFQSAIS